jgi:hypothetical protein
LGSALPADRRYSSGSLTTNGSSMCMSGAYGIFNLKVTSEQTTPRITLAKIMASPCDNIRSLAGIFMTHFQIMIGGGTGLP